MAVRSLLIDDAARVLGVSRRTVYYRIREGKLLTLRAKCGSQRVLVSSIELLRAASIENVLAPAPPLPTAPGADT